MNETQAFSLRIQERTWAPGRYSQESDRGKKHTNSVCIYLSRLTSLYSLCLSKEVDGLHYLTLYHFGDFYEKIVGNKYSYQSNQQTMFVFVTFYHSKVTTGSDWKLRNRLLGH